MRRSCSILQQRRTSAAPHKQSWRPIPRIGRRRVEQSGRRRQNNLVIHGRAPGGHPGAQTPALSSIGTDRPVNAPSSGRPSGRPSSPRISGGPPARYSPTFPRRRAWDVHVTHLLSGIALCPCGAPSCPGGFAGVSVYRCRGGGRGHVARPSKPIDLFIRLVVARRLSQPDVADLLPLPTNGNAVEIARENAAALRIRLTEVSQSFAAGRITIGELETATGGDEGRPRGGRASDGRGCEARLRCGASWAAPILPPRSGMQPWRRSARPSDS
jgi:hypothetical protein